MSNAHINDSSVWRAFEDSELTHSAAHYLMTIMHLRQRQGYARVTDVAEHLRVSRGAVSRAMGLLKERNWIQEDPHRMLELTPQGIDLARSVQRNYLIVECFLEDILGVPAEVAREDACKMEHLLSRETSSALFRMIRVMMVDPEMKVTLAGRLRDAQVCDHQSPCEICTEFGECLAHETEPSDLDPEQLEANIVAFEERHEMAHRENEAANTISLADMQTGQRGIVQRVLGSGDIHRRILEMGISKDVIIEVESMAPLRDPIKVKVRGSSLSLRKSEAALIEVAEPKA